MVQEALTRIFREERKPRSKQKVRRHWWSKELQTLFTAKQTHLAKHGRDGRFRELKEELQEKISQEKNASFREYASSLDHRNRNRDVFRAVKSFGIRQPTAIAQLAVRDEDGKVVADMQQKANIFAAQYQEPLGRKDRTRSVGALDDPSELSWKTAETNLSAEQETNLSRKPHPPLNKRPTRNAREIRKTEERVGKLRPC